MAKNPYDGGFITGVVCLAKEGSKSVVVESDDDGKKYIRDREDVKPIT